jgi:hypothetical protein
MAECEGRDAAVADLLPAAISRDCGRGWRSSAPGPESGIHFLADIVHGRNQVVHEPLRHIDRISIVFRPVPKSMRFLALPM